MSCDNFRCLQQAMIDWRFSLPLWSRGLALHRRRHHLPLLEAWIFDKNWMGDPQRRLTLVVKSFHMAKISDKLIVSFPRLARSRCLASASWSGPEGFFCIKAGRSCRGNHHVFAYSCYFIIAVYWYIVIGKAKYQAVGGFEHCRFSNPKLGWYNKIRLIVWHSSAG